MSDGSPKVPAQASPPASPPASATASYARIYEEQQPRLVAYARSLTRNNSWAAEDLVAEAHFRVWRRLSAGHEIENVPAYLMTTVRHLAATAVGEARETPHDPRTAAERTGNPAHAETGSVDPAEQVSEVDLLVRVLGQLPERWVQALWLAEAEGQPLETVGQRIGAKQGATAVLLHRAREGMRQAFLRSQTGAPDDPACEVHWVRMPAYVRDNATPRQSARLLAHVDACDDCRGRLAVLMRANDRLPALVGPALLVFAVGGAGKFLLPWAAGSVGATSALSGQLGSALHTARQAVTGGAGGAKVPTAIAAGATVAGAALAMMIALGANDPSPAPSSPRVPLAEAPLASRPWEGSGVAAEVPGERGGAAGVPRNGQDGQGWQGWADGGGGSSAGVDGADDSGTAVSAGRGVVVAGESGAEVPVDEMPGAAAPGTEEPAPVGDGAGDAPVTEAPVEDTPPQGEATPGGEGPAAPVPAAPVPAAPADPVEEQPEVPVQEPAYPSTPTPVQPGPVEEEPEVPETPETPASPETPAIPEAPETPPPETTDPAPAPAPTPAPAPAPAPTPQPTPEDPGDNCGH
ncbi:sigma-70 family RNA polymerase sigma factor [Streptomyces sp. CA-251387]|uniref:sigma-70 family RNA polymerase sigma factor n=1 Tax=Streptomyces sp. CA-251387 TaxID=3240064 RepID=UPI003D8A01CA